MTDPRVEALRQWGVGARRPTPAQIAQMDRMMRDLESIPDSTYSDLEAAATEIAPDPEMVRPYYGRRPGTRARMDGTPAMPGAEFASPEEAAEYTLMGTDPVTGARTPSPHAQYMKDQINLEQVATPDGPAFMASGADVAPMSPDGTVNPDFLRRQQMLAPNPRLGGAPSWEPDSSMMTPGGENVEVMVPTQANRDRLAAHNTLRQETDHIRRMQAYGRQANPDARPEDLLEAAGEVPATQAERHAAQMRARAMARGAAEARRRELAMAQHAPEIRNLIRLQQRNPELYDQMVAENARPRNIQQRWNPRTGQFEVSSEVAYQPPEPPQDGRALMAMIQREMAAKLEADKTNEQKINVRARALVLANPSMGGVLRGLTREEARQRLIREKLADVAVIDEVLNEIYGPSAEPSPSPAAATPYSADPTRTLPSMPGPDGRGTGMPYQYRY